MNTRLFSALLLLCFWGLQAQQIMGKVMSEDGLALPDVLVVNISTGKTTATNVEGRFLADGRPGEELRFVRKGFERSSIKIIAGQTDILVTMLPVVHLIEEVQIDPWTLTGDLRKDARALSVVDKNAALRKEISVPAPPEKPRETPPPTVEEVGAVKYLASNLNLNTLYKNISGDGRRMRQLYKFEDQQELQNWVVKRFGQAYFTDLGIAKENIPLFLDFIFAKDADIQKYVKAGNSSAVAARMESLVPNFLGLTAKD